MQVLTDEGVAVDDAEAAFEAAGGSPGRALAFLKTGVVARRREMTALLDGRRSIGEFLKQAAEAEAEAALEGDPLGSKDAFTRDGYRQWLGLGADYLRRQLLDEPADAWHTCDRIEAMHRAERYLLANVNRDLVLRQLDLALAR